MILVMNGGVQSPLARHPKHQRRKMGKFKRICKKKDCTDCTKPFMYNNRMCYDDKYNLQSLDHRERFTKKGKTFVINSLDQKVLDYFDNKDFTENSVNYRIFIYNLAEGLSAKFSLIDHEVEEILDAFFIENKDILINYSDYLLSTVEFRQKLAGYGYFITQQGIWKNIQNKKFSYTTKTPRDYFFSKKDIYTAVRFGKSKNAQ